jgi:hypothetical protein
VRGQAETRTASESFGPGLGLASPAPRKEMPGAPKSGPRGWPSALGVRPETRGKTRGWLHEAKGGLPGTATYARFSCLAKNKTKFFFSPKAVNHRLSTAAQVSTGLQVDGDQFASDSVIRRPVLSNRDSHQGRFHRRIDADCAPVHRVLLGFQFERDDRNARLRGRSYVSRDGPNCFLRSVPQLRRAPVNRSVQLPLTKARHKS